MRHRTRYIAIVVAAAVVAASCRLAPAATPLDCVDWRYGPADEPAAGVLPPELDRDNFELTSLRDPAFADSPHNLCGQKGPAVDLAMGVTKGRDDVLIAVLDSGIKWRDPTDMAELATKAHINLAEARPACAAPDGDCNGDGVFDIDDFAGLVDRNGNGMADPEDLILDPAYNDGVDDDGNGWVDDISGWDFLYGDNNPLDTVEYGHGTGEAKDSVAAENGTGQVGVCPLCRFLPVRLSDSFIVDGGRFAAGVLFSLDSGADVIQEATGAISNPPQAQQAIDAAYERGVVVVASMADEAAKHPNLPSSLERTMTVNSITRKEPPLGGATEGYLALNGCTNYGGRTFVSVPSTSCSSEATGLSSGMVGLLESAAREFAVAAHPDLDGDAGTNRLSANEAMQIVRSTADDIDFSTPNGVDPANDFGASTGGLIDTVRYPSTPHWDATYGYGRINAYEIVKAVRDGRIPPEAEIDEPLWFELVPGDAELEITGRVAAVRADSYDYRVELALGAQPPLHPDRQFWFTVASGEGLTAPKEGELAEVDLEKFAALLPAGGTGAPVDPATGLPDPERFSVRVRVEVTAHGGEGDGLTGEMQKQIFVHHDPARRDGGPDRIAGAGTSSPRWADLDGRPGDELVVATDDGQIHALRTDGRGRLRDFGRWPVRGDTAPWWNDRSPTARADHIRPPAGGFGIGAPAVGDLDGDGEPEVVAADLSGTVYVWDRRGRRLATATIDPAFSRDDPAAQDRFNRTKPGIASSPALGDLDGDGDLEIVVAALDRHVYAFHHDGTPVAGFPVLVVDPAKVDAVDPVTHRVTFAAGSGVDLGGELIATPALADLTGDGRPEIVVGAQEQYAEPINVGSGTDVLGLLGALETPGNTRLYAIDPDGTLAGHPDTSAAHPDEQAYLPGWPAALGQFVLDLLPTIGDGVLTQAAIGDVHPANPGPEIVAASAVGPLYVLAADGTSVYGTVGGKDVPLLWSAGLLGQHLTDFGGARNSEDVVATLVAFSGAAIGRLAGPDPDVAVPTGGLTRLLDSAAPDRQLPGDNQMMAFDPVTNTALEGFPQVVADQVFTAAPVIGDLDGDGANEVISGNGAYTLDAFEADGSRPAGFPKLTGGWTIGAPALGDADGDGRAELAAIRRDGVVLVWDTAASLPAEWPEFGCDPHNTGACTAN